jgi:membrane associated rhomboid family serine protease
MFLPLHDGVPLAHLKTPAMVRAAIVLCLIAYALTFYGPVDEDYVVAGLGLIPAVLFGTASLPEGLPWVPEWATPLTSIFLHGSLVHLLGNMLFLWVFGDNVEDAMGHARFLAFFLLCGAAAGLTHALVTPDETRPLIGASGSVSGVVAAYLVLYPRVRLWGLFLTGIPLRVPAYGAIGFWFLLQLLSAFFSGEAAVGWFAHLGGFVAGAALVFPLRKRYDPVLARVAANELRASR